MKITLLTKKEICAIKLFVNKAKNLELVDGIYLLSFYDKNTNQEHIIIDTIIDINKFYNGNEWNDTLIEEEVKKESDDLDEIVEDFNKIFNGKRLFFDEPAASENYMWTMLHQREVLYEMELVNGILLFDRNNKYEENKAIASQTLPIYENRLEIENIDELLAEPTHAYKKSK